MPTEAEPKEDDATEVRALLAQLNADLRERTAVDMSTEGMFSNVLKGCFLKSYEFAVLSHETLAPGVAFFVAPSLRGICEDFIALSYLRQKRTLVERDELVEKRAKHQLQTAAEKQVAFFKRARPYQPVVALKEGVGFPESGLPKVRSMASAVGLDDLYDFVYAITSDVVHFNPRIIIRNAWGDHPKFLHSTSNFDPYYRSFCRIYSLYFLCAFSNEFVADFELAPESVLVLTKLAAALESELRWPEAVTYEEMNLEPPSDILRLLAKAAHRAKGRESAEEDTSSEPPQNEGVSNSES